MKNKIVHILLSPLFVSFVITLGIIYFIPNYFTRYKLELKEHTYLDENIRVFFPDLNNNKLSERILGVIFENSSFILYDEKNNLVDQWNFSGQFIGGLNILWFFDTDSDGFKEIYAVTQKADSIFLNIAAPFSKNGINKEIKRVFIDIVGEHNKKFSCEANNFKLSNHKIDGIKEVFFTITTGFAGYPRNAYKYNSKTNQITRSKHLTNVSFIEEIIDINNDGFDEILFRNTSNGNRLDSLYTTRSDYSLWLNVLDHNLNFLFDPLEIKVPFSELYALPFKSGDKFKILCLLNSRQKTDSKSKLSIFSNLGVLIKQKELQSDQCEIYLNSKKDGFILFDMTSGLLKKMNFELDEISSFHLATNSNLYPIDINDDSTNEWLNIAKNKSRFTVYNENFKEGLSFVFPEFERTVFLYGIKKTNEGNLFYIQNGEYNYIFSYFKNKYYYFEYLIYLAIFLAVLTLVLLIARGQKIRSEKKYAIEKEMAELQLKTIKSQVDPHFIFNAINTISGLMLTDKKLEADEFICNFSDLMRSALQKSNKIICTLEEEVEFIEKYIKLQQVRYNNKFEYQLNINSNVNLQDTVPKHVLYSYVENAIKHGLNGKENGLLKINITVINNQLVLVIDDNGIGMNMSNKKTSKRNATGNGLKIMEKIYALYTKLYKKKISHTINEVYDTDKKIMGVRVKVIISK